MRSLLVLIVIAACSPPATAPAVRAPSAPAWKGPEILGEVPADTPYLIASLEAPSPAVRARLMAQNFDHVKSALKKVASGEGKLALVAAALYAELDGTDSAHWMEALGLSSDDHFVLYGMSLWPVARYEVHDPARVRALLARVVKAAAPDLQPSAVGRAMLYTVHEKQIALVFGMVDRELVAALAPDAVLDRMMPALTGTEKPAKSLRDAPVIPVMLARHHYIPGTIGYLDALRVLEAVSGHGKGQYDTLLAMLDGKITPPCQDDLARMASVMPRFVFGYHRLDERGFAASLGVEVPADVTRGLAKLHTPMPAMPTAQRPLFAMSAAVNIDAMFAWMRDATSQLRSRPFRCDAFDKLNHAIDDLGIALDKPVPPMVQGLRGFELVIDDASVLPPSGTGHVLVAGDHIADLFHQMLAQVPQLAALQVPPDGVPVELPLAQLGVPASFKSAHVALRPTRAALAVGDDSAHRASARAGAGDAHVPLVDVFFDLPKLRSRFGMFLKDEDLEQLSALGSTSFALDVGDAGISVEMVGAWPQAH